MDTTKTLIERLRADMGGATNYGLAKHLGVAKSAVIRWVHERGGMSFDIGVRVGTELGLPPDYVLLCLAAEREQSDQVKPMWQRLAHQARGKTAQPGQRTRRSAKVAAVLLASGMAGLAASTPPQAPASALPPSVYSVKSPRGGRRSRWAPRIGRPHRIRRHRHSRPPERQPITAD